MGLLAATQLAPALPAAEEAVALRDGKQLKVLLAEPLNAQPALAPLIENWITPVEHFYVRSHAPVPEVDVASFRLSVEGMVERPLSIGVQQLREEFKQQTALATMTCAGNRRNEHSLVKKIDGVPWEAGAIGNARWGGTRLADVLKKAGVKSGAKHVWFESVDRIERDGGTIPFGASIPLDKALAEKTEGAVLVADQMNGKPLPADHGFPLRTVVPGYIGARSVKWLGRIVVSDRPSPNHYVANAYKIVSEGTKAEFAAAKPIYNYPINSVICRPADGAAAKKGDLRVQGYALANGYDGRTIDRVLVSVDGGKEWKGAKIVSPNRAFCWCLWQADIALAAQSKSITVMAIDSAGFAQPEKIDWNAKGYLFNSWHRIGIRPSS